METITVSGNFKPLGRKAYGSIPHLSGSRLGPGDHHISEGQERICTEKKRDRHDFVVIQEKLDGCCVAVANVGGEIMALKRNGELAKASRFRFIRWFDEWVKRYKRHFGFLEPGEWCAGEWLVVAHGTKYKKITRPIEWFRPFDIFRPDRTRKCYFDCEDLWVDNGLRGPQIGFRNRPMPPDYAIKSVQMMDCLGGNDIEGIVYRVERYGEVDFLAKWVRPDKIDGKYLPDPENDGDYVFNVDPNAIYDWSE